ncbi:hypothetical protein EN759_00335 [Mesorhizobium sp. M00.F.Ca.ET.038.03.1.1]|nr:hypothetical protein EN759_00335 [Mesorhizobium sp. M00.F.Ca.ET.038.03.1.1]
MTDAEIHEIARRAAQEAVKETFLMLGLDPEKPLEAQKDMAFVRKTRTSADAIQRQSILAAVGLITVALLGLIYSNIRGH